MQEVFEKMIKLIDFEKSLYTRTNKCEGLEPYVQEAIGKSYDNANEIVKAVAAEYNNGWIPCSERLPVGKEWEIIDEDGDTLYKHVLCQTYDSGVPIVVGFYQTDNWFTADTYDTIEVIAWQPLPPSFEPKNHSGEFNGMVEED